MSNRYSRQINDAMLARALAEMYANEEEQTKRDMQLAIEMMKEEEKGNDASLALALSLMDEPQPAERISYKKDSIEFNCVHCGARISVLYSEFNCRIFRCGQFIGADNIMQQVPQHARQNEVVAIKSRAKRFFGCGNPFRIEGDHLKKNVQIVRGNWTD